MLVFGHNCTAYIDVRLKLSSTILCSLGIMLFWYIYIYIYICFVSTGMTKSAWRSCFSAVPWHTIHNISWFYSWVAGAMGVKFLPKETTVAGCHSRASSLGPFDYIPGRCPDSLLLPPQNCNCCNDFFKDVGTEPSEPSTTEADISHIFWIFILRSIAISMVLFSS